MARLFVRHTVSDYAAWRSVYDSVADAQKALGVTGAGVYRSVDNPNDVTVWHDFASADGAQAFLASPQIRDAMGRAGIQGAPTIWITNPA